MSVLETDFGSFYALMKVRDVVSEKATGAMRLQFWKDAVETLTEVCST